MRNYIWFSAILAVAAGTLIILCVFVFSDSTTIMCSLSLATVFFLLLGLMCHETGKGKVEDVDRFKPGVLYKKLGSIPKGTGTLVFLESRRGTHAVEMREDPPDHFTVADGEIREVTAPPEDQES